MSIENQNPEKNIESKEQKLPTLHFDFFFTFHNTPEDARGLEDRFEKADIFIPEMHAWTKETLQLYENISNGNMTLEEALRKSENEAFSFGVAIIQMIYNSHKPIVFIDEDEKQAKIFNTKKGEFQMQFGDQVSFETQISQFKEYLKNFSHAHKDREDIILGNLLPRIKEILEVSPDLAKKKDLRILIVLGAAHTRVFKFLHEAEYDVSRKFSNEHTVFPYFTEAERAISRGKPVDDEIIARALPQKLVRPILDKISISQNTNLLVKFYRKIILQFSFAEIKDIFSKSDKKTATMRAFQYMDQKRIKLPKSEEDLKNLNSLIK